MELRPGYKQTEVGVIPEDWQLVPMGSLGTFGKGQGIRKDEAASGDIPCVRYGELYTHHNDIIRSFNSRISLDVAKTSKRLNKDDLLFAGSGETKEEIGKCVAFVGDEEAYAGGDIVILSPSTGVSSFLGYLFNAPMVASQKASKGQGDAVVHISASALSSIKVPLPPTEAEQRAIATALSDVDALLARLDQLIAKKRNLKQAAMQQLLTGQTRLPEFSGDWEVKRLGSVLRFQVGCPFSSAYFNDDEQGLRLVKNRDLKSDDQVFYYSGVYDDSYLVSDGDVLVGMDGDFRPCRWAKGTSLLNQRVGRVVPSTDLDARFAYYFLIEPLKEIEAATSSTTVKHLSHGDVEGIEKPIPAIREQTAIATVLSDMDTEIATLEARRDKTRALKQGMMQELLTGRIRLV